MASCSLDREKLSELYKPLHDPLIKSSLEIVNLDKEQTTSTARRLWSKVFPRPQRCWLPTGCLVGLSHATLYLVVKFAIVTFDTM